MPRIMKLLPLCAATLLVSCSTPPLTKRVDSLLLSRAPGEVIAPVETTRGLALTARDARADSARLVRERAAAVDLARGEQSVAGRGEGEAEGGEGDASPRSGRSARVAVLEEHVLAV